MRILLLIPRNSYRARAYLEAARLLELDLCIATDHSPALPNPSVVGVPLDRPAAAAAALAALHRGRRFDGVLATDERTALIAAEAAALMGLPQNTPDSLRRVHDKIRFRRTLERRGLPQPRFRVIEEDMDDDFPHPGLPCVVKPPSLSGGRGVIRVDRREDLARAVRRVRRVVRRTLGGGGGPLLVEQFVGDRELAIEGTLSEGRLHPVAVFDKPGQSAGPYFEETMLVTPSRLAPARLVACLAVAQSVVDATGLSRGPIHLELRVGRDGVWPLEAAARPIGGQCAEVIRLADGTSWEQQLLAQAGGTAVSELEREAQAVGVYMLPVPRAGRLAGVVGVDLARAVPGVVDAVVTTPRGRYVEPLPDAAHYLGFIFARATSAPAVERALSSAAATLRVELEAGRGAAAGGMA